MVRTVRPKFIRKASSVAEALTAADAPTELERTEVLIAAPADLPIPRGLAGSGLLAETIVRRWGDQLPLNRQEGIYAREGIDLSRSALCGWHDALSELASPLLRAMWEKRAAAEPWRGRPMRGSDATVVATLPADGSKLLMRYRLEAADERGPAIALRSSVGETGGRLLP